jgi:hypothetical protein
VIIVDFSRVLFATVSVALRNNKNETPDISFLRHLVLNSIRAQRKKFEPQYGEFIIAMDSRSYWRKEAFPYYKANRAEGREASEIDWSAIFAMTDQIKLELAEYFPYKIINVPGAEADDVIAVLTKKHHSAGVLILANDHDFVQLHTLPNVKQWNPVMQKWVREKDPVKYLRDHIVRGDKGDGIPNIHENDTALIGLAKGSPRRPSVTQKMLKDWFGEDGTKEPRLTMKADQYRNYIRNRELIDFDYIPSHIVTAILDAYDNAPSGDRSKLFNYFIDKRLRNLMGQIGDF